MIDWFLTGSFLFPGRRKAKHMNLLSLKLGFGAVFTTGLLLLANNPSYAGEQVLGGINVSEYCDSLIGGEAVLQPGYQDAYSWRCVVTGKNLPDLPGTLYDLDFHAACQHKYNDRATDVRAYTRKDKDPMAWSCAGTPKPNVLL
jgi:hypothetical protein